MTPTPKNILTFPERKLITRSYPVTPEDDIVISGMSGKFPNSRNIDELSFNLYNKIDMVDDAEHRWGHVNPEIPRRMGKLREINKFDAKFFGIPNKIGHTIDPQSRILVETAYEAVLDAGINPNTLKGSKTGVYMGTCTADAEYTWFYDKITDGGYGIVGCARAMLANRISNVMELKGPSILMDTACSSSFTAIDVAFSAMRNGEIDAALVGGCNIISHPHATLQFTRFGVLSRDGFCRPFDIDASGYTRSEAVCILFLQKAKNAKRIYSTLLYSKINSDGFKPEGITYPAGPIQQKLLTEFYEDININPKYVDYVEAHSTGTFVGDPEECQALENVYCKERTKPLPVGSIKSNIGHTEATSGVCSIVKVHLAFETQLIAPNIHFKHCRPTIPSLTGGSLKVCSEITSLDGPLVGINSFGFGGANAHVLIKQNPKIKDNCRLPTDVIPRLIFWTGRTEESVHTIFNDIKIRPLDVEYCALINNIQTEKISGNNYRGFALYEQDNKKNATELDRDIEYYIESKYPLVWIFNGLSTEWTEMGKDLFEISIIRETIQYCHDLLIPFNVNLVNIITANHAKINNHLFNATISIVVIQICFVEILRQLNIVPNWIIGHSIGELTCAYADGIITIQETIIAGYILATKISNVSQTAVIGADHNYLIKMLPSTIQIIHFNYENETSIINGPVKDVKKFLSHLVDESIFLDEIFTNCEEFKMLNYLNRIFVKNFKPTKWIVQLDSTDGLINPNANQKDSNDLNKLNLLTDPVISLKLFNQLCNKLSKKGITLEIGPSPMLHKILCNSFPKRKNLTLINNSHKSNVTSLLKTLGNLFIFGLDIHINNIYPSVKFPVSRGTRIISPLIKWDYDQDWYVTGCEIWRTSRLAERKVKITLTDHDYEFIAGHVIDGRCLVPATEYLQLVWETLAVIDGTIFYDLDIEFQDIRFLRATSLTRGQSIELIIRNQLGTGNFEIVEGTTTIVTGFVNKSARYTLNKLETLPVTNFPILTEKDFYKELRLRGYHYSGTFRAVQLARGDGLYGQVKWELDNWVAFMDCMLQVSILGKDSRSLALPTRLQRLTINTKEHMKHVSLLDPENSIFNVYSNKALNMITAGGIEIVGLTTSTVARRKALGHPILEKYEFISYLPAPKLDVVNAVRVCVQLVLENNSTLKIKGLEMNLNGRKPIVQYFRDALNDIPLVMSDLSLITNEDFTSTRINVIDVKLSELTNLTFIISSDPLTSFSMEIVEQQEASLNEKGYLVLRSDIETYFNDVPAAFQLICEIPMESEKLSLFQRIKQVSDDNPVVINVSDSDKNYEWIEQYKNALKHKSVILYARNEKCSGLLGLTNCIRKESDGKQTVCFFIDDVNAPPFSIDNIFYQEQLKLGLAINVYRNRKWGSYRHVLLTIDTEQKPRDDHCFANMLQKSDLSTLCWLQGSIDMNKEENVVSLQYVALNFRDIMLATGRIPVDLIISDRVHQENFLGFEFAGINKKNQKMMGIIISGALATQILQSDVLTWVVPNHWSLRDAATCPIIYLTVYLAFFKCTTIKKGKSILIHAGSGGVGLAAIRIALAYDLEVFITVSNDSKKKFVMEQYPKLKESHIGNSRDCSFETMIKIKTKGKGVDYVLNSLSDDKLHASVRCLGRGGTFMEIGKFDQSNDTRISMYPFLKAVNFRSVHVDKLFSHRPIEALYFTELIARDLKSGIIQPIPSTVFTVNEIEKSFRYLSTGKHVGKVVIKIRDDPYGKSDPISVLPRAYFDPNFVYIIAGGLGGFGLELTDWLVIRGARKIILSSKRGITKMYQLYRIRIWESYSCEVIVSTADITNYQGCVNLFNETLKIGPIGGIFNLAVSLKDDIMENQRPERFIECMAPKAVATKHLDALSRQICPQLKYFVVFSSVSCGRGNVGQPNYGMANSVMERIIEQRMQLGLPGKAIQWGAVGEVGLVAEMVGDKIDVEIAGTIQQRISSCLQELDMLLLTTDPIVSCMVVAEKRNESSGSGNLMESILNIFGIRDIKSLSMTTTLSEAGMDSLMTTEINQMLEREFEIFLTPQELRSLSFGKLKEIGDVDGQLKKKSKNESNRQEVGLYPLVKNLGNEINSKETLLRLTTLNNCDKFDSCILIVPGIEGVASSAWHNLATHIKLPSFILQLMNSIDKDYLSDIVETVAQTVLNVFAEKKQFHLIGYSFGGLVTLEIARILENAGMKGQVLIIDGAPVFIKRLGQTHIQTNNITDKAMEIMLLLAIIKTMFVTGIPESLIIMKLSECVTWGNRLDLFLDLIKSQQLYSETYLRSVTNGMLNRVKSIFMTDTENPPKIKSSIILVRPKDISLTDIQDDYELSRYTDGNVDVKFVDGNHSSMLENNMLVNIINEYFASES